MNNLPPRSHEQNRNTQHPPRGYLRRLIGKIGTRNVATELGPTASHKKYREIEVETLVAFRGAAVIPADYFEHLVKSGKELYAERNQQQ